MRLFLAWFEEEEALLGAVRAAREAGLRVADVYTPYAVHGMPEAMGLRPSRLTWVCFGMGCLGLSFALWLQDWTSAWDWPLNVGGKPLHSFPAFVPVAFELTVLLAALGTVAALFWRARLRPRSEARVPLDGVTHDRFVLAIHTTKGSFDAETAASVCEHFSATKTSFKEVES